MKSSVSFNKLTLNFIPALVSSGFLFIAATYFSIALSKLQLASILSNFLFLLMSPIYLTELQQHSLSLTSLQYHLLVYCSQYHICSILIHQYIGSLVYSSKHELSLQSQLPFLLKLNQLDSASLEYTSSDPF